MDRQTDDRKSYIVAAAIGLAVAAAVMFLRGIASSESVNAALRCVCDGFTVAGILYVGIAGLIFAGNEGQFDILAFGVKQVKRTFTQKDLYKDKETLYDYKKAKEGKKKPTKYMLFTGIAFLLCALIALLLYHTV